MGLLTLPLKLPLLPLKEVIRIAELIRQETERQYHDPARVRRELEEAQQRYSAGDMSEDELSRVQYAVTSRLYGGMPANPRQRKTGGDRRGNQTARTRGQRTRGH